MRQGLETTNNYLKLLIYAKIHNLNFIQAKEEKFAICINLLEPYQSTSKLIWIALLLLLFLCG